jgi:hypothetical protein
MPRRVTRQLLQDRNRRLESPPTIGITYEMGFVEDKARKATEQGLGFTAQMGCELLGRHHDNGRVAGDSRAKSPGIDSRPGHSCEPSIEVPSELARQAVCWYDNACIASATGDVAHEDELGKKSLSSACGKGHDQSGYVR